MAKKELTLKQESYCTKFMECMSMSASYEFAFNCKKMKQATINRRAFDLHNMPKIQARIEQLKKQRSIRTKIDADYVLNRLVEIDKLDVSDILENNGDIKPIKDWPRSWRTSIGAVDISSIMNGDIETVIKKLKIPDKLKTLELIGKHVAVGAFDRNNDNNEKETPALNISFDVKDPVKEIKITRGS